MRNAFRPVGRFFCLVAWLAAWAMAQTSGPAMTQVTDIVYRADGTVAKGTVLISWPGFTTADGKAVAAGAVSVQLGNGGAFTASLAPNTGAQPAGVYYRVVYQLAGQEPSTEYWAVPATGSTTIGAVRAKLQPPTIAAQVLTRDVADTNYVHVNGDQTMKGVVTFASSPSVPTPQSPGDAANKGYVDSATAGISNLASPPPIGGTTPNAGTFTTLNRVINPTAYSGNDLGMKINAAIAANNCGNGIVSCSLELPPGAQLSYSTTIALPQDTRLACIPKAQNSQYAALNYTGNGHAIDLMGESASIDGCDWNIGASATEGIHQASLYTRVDNVSLNGGGSGTIMHHITGSNIAYVSNEKIWNLTGIGVLVDNSIDVYLRTMSVYGAIANGLTEQTSQSLVVESGVGGLQVTDWSGGGAGLHGLVIRNTVNQTAGAPTWLNFYNFVSDCSAGGDGWLFDSSLGASQIGATLVDSWSAGAGQDCSQTTMTNASAVGIHISGGSGIHIVGGGKVRANASHGVLIDGAGLKDIEIADNQFTANGFAADFQTSRSYSLLNSYVRPQTNNAGSYLYKLTVAGTSGASLPAWCQTLNCTTTTGTTAWQNIGTAAEADGIYVPNYVVQLNIHDNKVGNTPESGGILQWGVRVDQDDPGSLIHDNTVNDTAQGAVKTPSGILSNLAVHDNANAAGNQVSQQFSIGPLSWKLATGSNQGPAVIPNTTGSGYYIMGFGNNVSWNGTNFTTLTDTASNGASLMGMNYGSGAFSFYVVPTNTPSSGQTIPPSSMSSYLRASIDSNGINGTLGATTPFNATVNNLTVNGNCTGCGSGGSVNLGAPPAIGNVTPNAGNFTTLRASDTASTLFPEIDVRAFGAVGDGQIAGPGCAMAAGSHALTCASGTFAAGDVGKAIWVEGAGAATGCGVHVTCPLLSTISGYSSSSSVTVAAAATTAMTSGYIEWGTDNTAAIQAAVDLAIAPSALQHAVYLPHVLGQANNRFGCYAITGTIQLPESTISRNKFVTLHGDGNLASAICELRLGTPIITDTFLHQAGTGTIVRGLGFVGPPDYADVMGNAIECNYCIFIQVEHNWFTGWTNSIDMDVQGAGSVTGGELIYTFNVCEESITCIRWHGTGVNPGTTLVATHNTFDQMYNGSGFVLDLQYVTGIQEGYNTYGPNIGLGIKCDHCSSFNFGNDDFSQQAWGTTSQNVYLSNSSNGVVHGNTFHAVATEAVDLAGGNSSILFEGNTFGYLGATARPYMAWTAGNGPNTGITVSNETIDSCASPCINVASGAMSNSAISRNYFAASIATPITVTGGVPAGSCVATGSHDVCAPGSISAQTLSASGAVTVGGDLSARDIPGHEYFVSKYASIQAAINAAYNNGSVLGKVIDDRTSAYNGAGFYIPDSVTVELAPVPYTFTGTVTHNNGNNNVAAAIVVEQGAHLKGSSTSSNHGTVVGVSAGFAGDIIATTSEGTGIGTTAQWWHWGSIENLNLSGANQASGRCLVVENMGETSRVENIEARSCYGNNIEIIGASATQSSIRNITTMRSQTASGMRFTNLAGVGKVDGLSGDCNPTALVSVQENAAGSLTILGLKAEGEASICTGTVQDPVVLMDGMSGFNDHVRIIGGYAFGTAQSNFAKFVNAGNAILETDGLYITGYTNMLNDTVRSVTVPLSSSTSKQPFYYEPGGTTFANQAFTFTPGTFIQGGSSALTEIFGSSTDGSSMIAAQGNGDGTSYFTGGLKIGIPNRTQFGQPPEMMARMGSRFLGTGNGYDTNTWVFVPIWKTGDSSNRWIGEPNQRWPEVYAADVNATTATVGTLNVTSCVGCGSASAWGSIGGALSSQADLQTALAGKQNALGYTPLNPANNLSDVANLATAKSNLGVPGAASTVPVMDGTGAVGASASYARADHVHPTDTSRVATSTTVNGHPLTGNVTVTASDVGAPHSLSIQGPTSAVTGTGSMTALYSVTIPAGTFSAGTGIRCVARSRHTTGSGSVSMAWKLGSTTYTYPSTYTTGSTGGDASIEIFTFSSLTAETVNIPWASFGGTTESPYTGLAWSENVSGATTLQFQFNVGSSDKLTGDSFYCGTIQ